MVWLAVRTQFLGCKLVLAIIAQVLWVAGCFWLLRTISLGSAWLVAFCAHCFGGAVKTGLLRTLIMGCNFVMAVRTLLRGCRAVPAAFALLFGVAVQTWLLRTFLGGCSFVMAVRTFHVGCNAIMAVFALIHWVAQSLWLRSHVSWGLQARNGFDAPFWWVAGRLWLGSHYMGVFNPLWLLFANLFCVALYGWLFATCRWVSWLQWLFCLLHCFLCLLPCFLCFSFCCQCLLCCQNLGGMHNGMSCQPVIRNIGFGDR